MQKTPDKLEEKSGVEDEKTPEKLCSPEKDKTQIIKNNSTPLKEPKDVKSEFKTPEKTIKHNQTLESDVIATKKPDKSEFKTPEKNSKHHRSPEGDIIDNKTLQKNEFRTPEKTSQHNEPPETVVTESKASEKCIKDIDGEDGLISTTEQARLLIAASKTPSKSINKTPIKQNTPSAKRSLENSPITPGKHRRVELITLASPKAKRLKQM